MPYLKLLKEFEDKIRVNRNSKLTLMQEVVAGIYICNNALSDFRRTVAIESFKSKDEEAHFFKDVKSEPLCQLIHYSEVRSCLIKLPRCGLQAKLEFIDLEIKRVNSFFTNNLDFQLYMKSGGSERDKKYFTRKYFGNRPLNALYPCFRDPLFNTSHDEVWSTIKGFGLYGDYLKELKVKLIDTPNKISVPSEKVNPPFRFTMPATAAMEFIYAFKELRAFNHGNFDITPFTDYFSEVFDIEIKDPYGLFAQIANRKTKRAKYIQMLLDAFLNSLERRDEF